MQVDRFAILPDAGTGDFRLFARAVWLVAADGDYRVERGLPAERGRTVLVRTLCGSGRIELFDGSEFRVEAGTFLVLPDRSIHYYGAGRDGWEFGWFVCRGEGVPPYQLRRLYRDGMTPEKLARSRAAWDGMLDGWRSASPWPRRRSDAALLQSVYEWLNAAGEESGCGTPERIGPALELMHRQVDRPLKIAELAAECNLTPRHFRRLFEARMGETPKRYFDMLRLRAAAEVLHSGTGDNLKTVAERFGFRNPFQFSAAFRRHFGCAPTRWRAAEAGG